MSHGELPSRELILNGRKRKVYGSAQDDHYFSTLADESEWPFIRFCERYVRDHYNCLDIGANIGLMTLYIADYCTSGRIISVEPNRLVFSALQSTLRANEVANAVPVNAAITERDGEVRFAEDSAYGHIEPSGNAVVEGITLATLLERCRMDRVDFIKMDVEGHEPVILRAARDLLKRQRPLIFLEFNSWSLIQNHVEPLGFLEWVVREFASVHAVRHGPSAPDLLTRVTAENVKSIMFDNLMKRGCVDDLVATDDVSKLNPVRDIQVSAPGAESSRRSSVFNEAGALLKKVGSLMGKG
jgi:FkbM family methyltransferase